jgi:hypothetical protein
MSNSLAWFEKEFEKRERIMVDPITFCFLFYHEKKDKKATYFIGYSTNTLIRYYK